MSGTERTIADLLEECEGDRRIAALRLVTRLRVTLGQARAAVRDDYALGVRVVRHT